MEEVISSLIDSKLIRSASLSSNEPISFNVCLAKSKAIKINTFCYQHSNKHINVKSTLNLELVSSEDIPAIKTFLKEQVGMEDTFGYTENLVSRNEIFVIKEEETIISTTECRMSDSQPEIADLGIIVNKDYQGKGIATEIMKMQVNRVLKANRKPVCSTTLPVLKSSSALTGSSPASLIAGM